MIVFTRHARKKMGERGILESEVIEAVEVGEGIDVEADRRLSRVVLTAGYKWRGTEISPQGSDGSACQGRGPDDSVDCDSSLRQMGRGHMRITYDRVADAAYIYLADDIHMPETRHVDEDINLDFDEHNQLVGIEVLGASQRLQLGHLEPFLERLDAKGGNLKTALQRSKRAG